MGGSTRALEVRSLVLDIVSTASAKEIKRKKEWSKYRSKSNHSL